MICESRLLRGALHHQLVIIRECQQSTRILNVKAFIREVRSRSSYEKIGCLDFGTKCIGIAATDEMKTYSFPTGSIHVKQPPKSIDSVQDLHRQLQEFSAKEKIRYFVVGFPLMPVTMAVTPLCNHIVWSIQNFPPSDHPFTFCMWDESWSTSDARRLIKTASIKKSTVIKHKDAVAASVILRSFLHSFNAD